MKNDAIEQMLEALETPNRELTKWEEDFIVSIRGQFKERKSLSERQLEILERIYVEKAQ